MSTDALFPPFAVPEGWSRLAQERGWPEGLLQRLVDLRTADGEIERWLADPDLDVGQIDGWTTRRERLELGTLRARKADVSDADQFSAVWANSPMRIGDWEVTVERSPDPFAQWRLQENVVLNVLLDRGLMVACQGNSRRNTYVGGERFTVSLVQAVRVRKEFRRLDYSQLVAGGGGGPHPNAPVDNGVYMYVRAGNLAAYEWMKAVNPDGFPEDVDKHGGIPGVDVSVLMYPAAAADGGGADAAAGTIRAARREDLPRCVALINRTHGGLDLFRPYTVDFLENRLDEGYWAPKRWWSPHVYGWEDFRVVEDGDGKIVACGGLWDRGRDMREVWRKPHGEDGTEEEGGGRVVTATALMDFGYARGKSAAMAALVAHFIGVTHRLGRSFLLAPFQFEAAVARHLRDRGPVAEHRRIQWWPSHDAPAVPLARPYTDLAYW